MSKHSLEVDEDVSNMDPAVPSGTLAVHRHGQLWLLASNELVRSYSLFRIQNALATFKKYTHTKKINK